MLKNFIGQREFQLVQNIIIFQKWQLNVITHVWRVKSKFFKEPTEFHKKRIESFDFVSFKRNG